MNTKLSWGEISVRDPLNSECHLTPTPQQLCGGHFFFFKLGFILGSDETFWGAAGWKSAAKALHSQTGGGFAKLLSCWAQSIVSLFPSSKEEGQATVWNILRGNLLGWQVLGKKGRWLPTAFRMTPKNPPAELAKAALIRPPGIALASAFATHSPFQPPELC